MTTTTMHSVAEVHRLAVELVADLGAVSGRTDHRTCPACEATPAGCDSLRRLAGRWCCSTCTGTHEPDQSQQRGNTAP